MDSDSHSPFPFNAFSPTSFLSPASASASASPSASRSTVAGHNSRRKRSKFIKTTSDRLLSPSSSKPKSAKKPDPTAPKITRPCSECGKKFWSWKALFGHMRCHPEREWRGINPPPNFRRSSSSFPTESEYSTATDEDHEIAACLIMLANGPNAIEAVTETTDAECREIQESETAAALGRFMECVGPPSCRFECSSCKKVFGSHQALGGHRASHKNAKGCFAVARTDGGGGTEEECSVCMKAFSSGETICEHKRNQWEKEDEDHHHDHRQPYSSVMKEEGSGYLDLNLPPPMEDIEESSSSYSSGIVLDLRLGLN